MAKINTVKGFLKEEEEEIKDVAIIDKTKYRTMKQNQITDNISKGLADYKQLDLWGNATTLPTNKRKQEFSLTIEKFEELENQLSKELYDKNKANQSTGKLLDSFLIKMTENGFLNPMVSIPLKEYAEMTGKKDLKELRKRTKTDLQILKRVKFSYTPLKKTRGNNQDYINVYLFGGTEGIKNGQIIFKFNEDFFRIFAEQKYFLTIPIEVLQSNERKNPNTYLLYKKILSHNRMNRGKKNENIIKVKTLYEYCVTLPRYGEVMKTNRAVTQRIIEPFERDLDIIKEFSWCYDTPNPPTTFDEWINTNIKITWKNELPGTDTIIEGRKKQQKKIEKAKQRNLEKELKDKKD